MERMSEILNLEDWTDDLKKIRPKVKNVFYKGNIDLILSDRPRLAIVGSRRMTDYGAKVIEKWMGELVNAGVVVVSGFMYGVDQKAHRECMECGGETVAVLGWGIDWQVPENDVEIYEKIIETGGLILSEYQGEKMAELWTFPARDRVMAGICDAVLVVEAAEKSGSLITAKFARNFGKKVLAVPGQVTSKVAEGTNGLIKRGDGIMVSSAGDILKEMNLSVGQMSLLVDRYSSDPVLSLISDEPKTVDEISRILKINMTELLSKLTEMSLLGVVEERGGKFWRV